MLESCPHVCQVVILSPSSSKGFKEWGCMKQTLKTRYHQQLDTKQRPHSEALTVNKDLKTEQSVEVGRGEWEGSW